MIYGKRHLLLARVAAGSPERGCGCLDQYRSTTAPAHNLAGAIRHVCLPTLHGIAPTYIFTTIDRMIFDPQSPISKQNKPRRPIGIITRPDRDKPARHIAMASSRVLRVPQSEVDGAFVLVQVSSSGSKTLDLKLVATEGEAPYVIKRQFSPCWQTGDVRDLLLT